MPLAIVGDWVIEPSAWPTKIWLDRNRVTPGAMRLMAMPDTIWLTPKVTVAMPWTRPPSMPPKAPKTSAAHGP